MTMAAVSGDAAHLVQCSMLRASPDATGHQCRVSVCDVLPGQLPRSSKLPVDQWPTKHNFPNDIDKECSIFNVKTL
jgi:hypothetical protein